MGGRVDSRRHIGRQIYSATLSFAGPRSNVYSAGILRNNERCRQEGDS